MQDQLIKSIKFQEAMIGIVGLGYVGLPLMLRFVESGFQVLGFDIDSNKIDQLNCGETYIKHIDPKRIKSAWETGKFEATNDFSYAQKVDVLIICVPTPLGIHNEPDLSFIINTVNALIPYFRPGQIVSLESTTYPGTTDEEVLSRIESRGFTIGKDFFLVYSPEREDPGNYNFNTANTPKIVGGATSSCLEVGLALYNSIVDRVVPVSSTKVAEMSKLLENIYRAVNIGLVNELKMVCDRMDINIWEVIEAAATKPFGFTPFYPGPGLGGHCIPIDPFYLTWKAREYNVDTRFIELAGEINTAMPQWVVDKVTEALNERGKSVKGSRILLLGIAYKKNIDDSRESPAVELMDILQKKGAIISYADPYIPVFPKKRRYDFNLSSVDINAEVLSQIDCIVLATDHDVFDYEMILNKSDLIIDTRGRYRGCFSNVVNA
ncbi:UDP-glucose 6-dehydrogenase [Calothrix sp. NIES-2100]|uniref:nucleotide sugar dehydrogenase n=1 Tax=Calothrix sp. NIES-2100 TaxID=1954172 RepID=UPI000B5E3AB5|nr:UDP-glucose 6-dehydrogenase [Calothrix sp. NIES-2100]